MLKSGYPIISDIPSYVLMFVAETIFKQSLLSGSHTMMSSSRISSSFPPGAAVTVEVRDLWHVRHVPWHPSLHVPLRVSLLICPQGCQEWFLPGRGPAFLYVTVTISWQETLSWGSRLSHDVLCQLTACLFFFFFTLALFHFEILRSYFKAVTVA